ncbi:MAG TPA: glycoside hydrolase family 3 N-terminal domain-containing protein [Gemmatimonadales bacterium]|nr:glycoside hydrolase family 3 N-terminal domain-containing protein [Gemmatimonadales bacterium]
MTHCRLASRLGLPLALVALPACRPAAPPPAPAPVPAPRLVAGVPVPAADATAEQVFATLPLHAKAAQLVMPWIAGGYAAWDDPALVRAARWVDSLGVGGIIVSIGSPFEVAARVNHLQGLAAVPLLVASDLEAGTAIRLTGGTPFPTNMGVGATGREQDAWEMGRITAIEGRAVGVHLTFSPVADVNNNPANPIINTRSFGEDPAAVGRLVAGAIRGAQEHGMLATAKHFPGHGDTGTDSHIALPLIAADWARLDSLELVPFRAAIAAGVAAVMSAHVAMPALTGGDARAATVSPGVLGGILRDSLGFEGLAVTDALDMGALVSAYGPGEAAVLALEAGADLLLQPADPAAAVAAVVQSVESGRVSEARLDRSVRKLLGIKERLGLFRRRLVPLDSVPAAVGVRANLAVAGEVAARALVLVRDSLGAVDSLRARPQPVSLILYGDDTSPTAGRTLAAELRRLGREPTVVRLAPASGPASYDSARALLAAERPVVVAAAVRVSAWRGTLGLPDSLVALIEESSRIRPTTLVSLGSPYLILQTPGVQGYLLAWSAGPLTEAAAAAALAGVAPITGTLPIRLPPHYPLGHGLRRGEVE